jgi:hypothetical protein
VHRKAGGVALGRRSERKKSDVLATGRWMRVPVWRGKSDGATARNLKNPTIDLVDVGNRIECSAIRLPPQPARIATFIVVCNRMSGHDRRGLAAIGKRHGTKNARALLAALMLALPGPGQLRAQSLPTHPPLRILVVSDEVNPHGLRPEELTQPGDLSVALAAVPALHIDSTAESLLEIPTNQIEQASSRLMISPDDALGYDVLIYFDHRIPDNGMNDQARQDAFVSAVNQFLVAGGGVVSFHHGIYETNGKASMLDILGGQASGEVPWNTVSGQNVIAVDPRHFVSRYAARYPATTPFADAGLGIDSGDYPKFNNTPDERYPNLAPRAGVSGFLPLFTSDYSEGGSTHLLGFQHSQPLWAGVVIAYQPGEYQPNALGPGNNNFQILLNAIVFAGTYRSGGWLFAEGFESGVGP